MRLLLNSKFMYTKGFRAGPTRAPISKSIVNPLRDIKELFPPTLNINYTGPWSSGVSGIKTKAKALN